MNNLPQFPPAVDLRTIGALPPPYDQEGLNSCTAAAAAALAHHEMRLQDRGAAFIPSRMFLYYEERRDFPIFRDRPIRMEDSVRAVIRAGLCGEELWPYAPERAGDRPPPIAYANAVRPRIARQLGQDLNALRGCLAEGHPFLCGIVLFPSISGTAARLSGAVAMPRAGERVRSGHAILIVGYDDDRQCFVFRNSMGPNWGNRGDGTVPYRYLLDPALAYDFWTLREFGPLGDGEKGFRRSRPDRSRRVFRRIGTVIPSRRCWDHPMPMVICLIRSGQSFSLPTAWRRLPQLRAGRYGLYESDSCPAHSLLHPRSA